jgi:hypothetical protein
VINMPIGCSETASCQLTILGTSVDATSNLIE